MKPFYDPMTGRVQGYPGRPLPPQPDSLASGALEAALESFILTVSGWRKVFAPDETSDKTDITDVDAVLVAVAGRTIGELFRSSSSRFPPTVVLGIDSRPTGSAISDVLLRALLACELEVRFVAISPAPEMMAYCKMRPEIDGFVYVTASHNPIGHNGLKVGLGDGSVLDRLRAEQLIARFRANVVDRIYVAETAQATRSVSEDSIANHYDSFLGWKQQATRAYSAFLTTVITGESDDERSNRRIRELRASIAQADGGIVADFNGSARAASIDRVFLRELGYRFSSINDRPGAIAHSIIPEGESLLPCRDLLEQARREHPGFIAGYMPDNDGDRGNLVLITGERDRAVELPAQQGFALAVMSELAWHRFRHVQQNRPVPPVAVVVNDATSLRIERIAAVFGARVFRGEVGEANMVELAARARTEGYDVPILGEGSNGGTIIPPSTVRDPMTAIGSLTKLLYARDPERAIGPLTIWYELIDRTLPASERPSIARILETLPVFQTTATTDPDAVLRIDTTDHVQLKARYERLFVREWEQQRHVLADRLGIDSYEQINYEGCDENRGFGPEFRSGAQRGGFKMLFLDRDKAPVAFVWMRGSGTEAVFRVLADVHSADPADADFLLSWHRSLVAEADRQVSG